MFEFVVMWMCVVLVSSFVLRSAHVYVLLVFVCFFFFKQKTAYDLRISDWSSDVCSSDLKAGLVELTDDDRATLYGAMLDLAARAQGDGNALALWKRRGKRAFDAEAEGQDNAEGNAHD